MDIYFLAAAHQADPGRTSRPVPGLFFYPAARDWGGIYSVAAAPKDQDGPGGAVLVFSISERGFMKIVIRAVLLLNGVNQCGNAFVVNRVHDIHSLLFG